MTKEEILNQIKEYKSQLGDMYEEISIIEGYIKDLEDELNNLND